MKRLPLLLIGFLAASVCSLAAPPPQEPARAPAGGAAAGGPPVPPYQMRAPLPAGDRLAGGKDGAALFSNLCGACHLAGGMGTNLLTKQRVAAGQPPESGLLANRKDLTQTYVKVIVRRGKLAMPRLTRVEVTDAELDSIAKFLGKAGA
jgi:mono/diheme cytochrome c family protein